MQLGLKNAVIQPGLR